MKPKYTPGPWTVHSKVDGLEGIGIHSANGGYIYVATIHGPGSRGNIPSEANARLIAAAPELLEALFKIRDDATLDSSDVVAICNAAIAKATGGEE